MQRLTPVPSHIAVDTPAVDTPVDVPLQSPKPDDVSLSLKTVHYPIPEKIIDADAVKVIRRLTRFGYDAYLVGGCIRDMLFGLPPKDFDIATSALPSEIRKLFRNCRLIGRRFRLAHLLFKNGKIIEVATFRRSATEADDVSHQHAAENLFGGPGDDAIRRDFTINALMYDIGHRKIYDYVGGLGDIVTHSLRTIGDPDRRFKEDPVRIIRAVKFSKRLNLSIASDMMAAMTRHAPLLKACPPARLVEEVLKVLRSGASGACFQLLYNTGVLTELMPSMAHHVNDSGNAGSVWQYLQRVDAKISEGNCVSDTTMLGALIYPFCRHLLKQTGDVGRIFEAKIADLLAPMKFTKRHMMHVRQAFLAQRRMIGGPQTRRACQLLDRDYAVDALELKEITCKDDEDKKLLLDWIDAFTKRRNGSYETRRRRGRSNRRKHAPSGRPSKHRHSSRETKDREPRPSGKG
ncbi:MAG: polynucleotide adenylyltransferase PcnB [Myxococcota bacterium]|nr:polynucleotide adenylyltransferase PcnB [Myxococcota bacterium]